MKGLSSRRSAALCAGALAAVAAALPKVALAQAWVGEPGELSFSAAYVFATSSTLIQSGDAPDIENAGVTNHALMLGLEYVPIESLGVRLSLPILGLSGDEFAAHGSNDDGSLHLTPQDLRLDVRYQLLDLPVAIAAGLGGSLPVADYEVMGNAPAGRGLKQLHLNAALGYQIAGLYAHARYEFSLVESFSTDFPETSEIGQHKSDIAVQIGYFILDELEINAVLDLRLAHDGINLDQIDNNSLPAEERLTQALEDFHDPLLAENVLAIGGGGSYQITEDLAVNALVRFVLGGSNTQRAISFGGGVTWRIL